MTTTPAIIALLATIAVGAVVGVRFLMRARSARLVTLHLGLALLAFALVAVPVAQAPPSAIASAWPVGLLALAIAGGWGAGRVARRSGVAGQAMLVGHVFVGVASFLVLLAWARGGPA